jgi:hypothetical protein
MKNHFKVLLITAALGLVTLNANAQFGGLMGGGAKANANAVNPDVIEQSLKQMISGANRTNRLLAEALDMKELVTKSEDAAACLEKGSCGIADASAVSVSVNSDVQKKIEEMIKNGQKFNQESGDKVLKAGEGGLKQIVFAKKLMADAKNIDKSGMAALKAATVLKNLPDGVKALDGMFKSFESIFKVMSYSGISLGDLQTSMVSEFANIGKN